MNMKLSSSAATLQDDGSPLFEVEKQLGRLAQQNCRGRSWQPWATGARKWANPEQAWVVVADWPEPGETAGRT